MVNLNFTVAAGRVGRIINLKYNLSIRKLSQYYSRSRLCSILCGRNTSKLFCLRSAYNKCLIRSLATEKAEQWTIPKVAERMRFGTINNIIVLTGAGVSTASGLPDFRSPGSGLYDSLHDSEIVDPVDVFDIYFFDRNPRPFYRIAKDLYPGKYKPNYCHFFIRLLEWKGLLLRAYTQNIDGLERKAGVVEEKLVEAHGSFVTASCRVCKESYTCTDIEEQVMKQEVPYCKQCQGVIKPDVVFFGENLPMKFFTMSSEDFPQCDLLIVMGTSLQVHPFASLLHATPSHIPRILFNNELVGVFGTSARDIAQIGEITHSLKGFVELLGWEKEMNVVLNA